MATTSLKYRKHQLSNVEKQISTLARFPQFSQTLQNKKQKELQAISPRILQLNLGYLCNQSCQHCHVDAGPDRKELMKKETLKLCLKVWANEDFETLDITGGAPEMHPHFRYLVEEARKQKPKAEIIVRSNLSIIVSHPKYYDLPVFFAKNQIHIISSLPFYNEESTDTQRGKGIFRKSIEALTRLNAIQYGKSNSQLKLDLIYNPNGAYLPAPQNELEKIFKEKLKEYSIEFHHLFTITNTPIHRFLDFLIQSDNYEEYMNKLIHSFNPNTLNSLMCRDTISVDYLGYLYDCDFNQMLKMKVNSKNSQHIKNYKKEALENRTINVRQHCYACTAGAGSSCQGELA